MSLSSAIEALIGPQSFTVGVNSVPATATDYVVVWVPPGSLSSEDVANSSDLEESVFTVTAVGRAAGAASHYARVVRDALVGKHPDVSGWLAGPVVQLGLPVGPRRDEDRPDMTVYTVSCNYEVRAARA